MKKSNLKTAVELLIIMVVSLSLILAGRLAFSYDSDQGGDEVIESAKITRLTDVRNEEIGGVLNSIIVFEAEILTGEHKGQVVTLEQHINEMIIDNSGPVEEGQRVLISNENLMGNGGSDSQWYYMQRDRIPGMVCFGLVFLVLLLIIGRMKGLTTIVALGFTGAAVFTVYIPAILSGINVYFITIVITIYIVFASLMLLNGINKKTMCAIVGNIGGIIAAGVSAFIVNRALGITGMVDEGFVYLVSSGDGASLDLKAIVWGCIVIGSLGAIMDVSMSIASAMQELAYEMKDRTFGRMVKSGMNIGRDAIGTMTITLVLAYTGSSIASLLLFTMTSKSPSMLLNYEMVVVEVIQAIAGSLGIILAVPITVAFAAWVFNKHKRVEKRKRA